MKKIIITIILLLLPITISAETIKGKFNYLPAFSDETEEIYYYSDDYFKQSGTIYNEHLLTMSYNLSLSSFGLKSSKNVTNLYEDLGFDNIVINDLIEQPSPDTIGTAIAHKQIGKYNLIAVSIRGEKYQSEWINNFIVGKTGNAKGHNNASIKVINRIKEYINNNQLDNIKIWVSGYSRAGSIANLIGVYINNNLEEFNTTKDDIYIYSFSPLASSEDDKIYNNIYTIINKNDLLSFLYPKEWNLHTNGKTIYIGEDISIKTKYGLLKETPYKKVTMNKFIKENLSWITRNLTREVYADNLEEPITNIMKIMYNKTPEEKDEIIDFIQQDIFGDNIIRMFLITKTLDITYHNSDYVYHNLTNFYIETLENKLELINKELFTKEELKTIEDSIYPIIRTIGPIIVDDYSYYEGIDYEKFYQAKEEYNLDDYELGLKEGTNKGTQNGYEDGINNKIIKPVSLNIPDYGPEYEKGYNKAYIESYLKSYKLALYHNNNPLEKAKYIANNKGKEQGYIDGINKKDKNTKDNKFIKEDWMTEDYIKTYNNTYKESYLKAYEQSIKIKQPKVLELYHIRSLISNIKEIIYNHYPQTNLSLIQNKDSYYKNNKKEKNPYTKDNLYIYISILIISSIVLVTSIIQIKKLNNNMI